MKIKGIEFSEETIVNALEKAGISLEKPKPYQFQAGDIARNCVGKIRIIVSEAGRVFSVNINGNIGGSNGQSGFEEYEYVKIGVLSDYIK